MFCCCWGLRPLRPPPSGGSPRALRGPSGGSPRALRGLSEDYRCNCLVARIPETSGITRSGGRVRGDARIRRPRKTECGKTEGIGQKIGQ